MITSAMQLERKLVRSGSEFLGSGCYSKVYTHPKRTDLVIKLNHFPDYNLPYLLWAAENGFAGVDAPRAFAAHEYEDGTYAVVMERLRPLPASDRYMVMREWLDSFRGGKTVFGKAMHAHFECVGDLHGDNVMLRGSQVVLTDPNISGESYPSTPSRYTRHQIERALAH